MNSSVNNQQSLVGKSGSGKSSVIVLKAIFEKLKNQNLRVCIISSTKHSCNILRKKILSIVEYANISFDLNSIEIMTPKELVNKHLLKLKKPLLVDELKIDADLITKKHDAADLIFCDDANLLSRDFILYLKHMQKNSTLVLVNDPNSTEDVYTLKQRYIGNNLKIIFEKVNPYAKVLHIVSNLILNNDAKDIMIVSSFLSREKLYDDMKYFIKDKVVLLDSSENLNSDDALLLSTYADISGMRSKFVILLDVLDATEEELKYAVGLCEDSAYILYEQECENIKEIRRYFESS